MTISSSGHRPVRGTANADDTLVGDGRLDGLPAPRRPGEPSEPADREPADTGPAPVVRPSVVHVPAPLLPLIAAERRASGRSNGQILIAAIEDGHEHLVRIHQDSTSIGGRLFAARAAKPHLPDAQPLCPLNIRLFEQDYDVLDRLVTELEVGSRSRLATLALSHYLEQTS